jgi:hypothetical protein
MSAGVFTRSFYTASYDDAQIHPIRVQPETIAASVGGTANTAPAGPATSPISAVISLGKRQLGLRPRTITIAAPATGQPDGYQPGGITTIPALNQAIWDAALRGTAVTYLGVATFQVVSRDREEAK